MRSGSLSFLRSAALVALALQAAAANARASNLVIHATFDSSITSLTDAAVIEAGINAAIGRLESSIENPITVNIEFQNVGSGLGQSETAAGEITYSRYLNDLATKQILSVNDKIALAHLPAGPNNPVDGDPDMVLTTPLLRVLGISTAGILLPGGYDGIIGLNTSLMNVSRTGAQNGSKYDLQSVVAHEMDEVLGTGGAGSVLPTVSGPVGVLDLFRYSANRVRSFSTSGPTPYFSIDGGKTDISNFNQAGGGSDYADWGNNAKPQVQDAFGTPGIDLNIGPNELEALDVVGYNLVAVPEPSSLIALGGLAVAGLIFAARRRTAR
jgi:hypothetical protein